MNDVKERPILFSAPMIRAILAGSKTMTRRVVKLPHNNPLGVWEPTTVGGKGVYFDVLKTKPAPEMAAIWHTRTGDCLTSPYRVGSTLWVRETFQPFFADGVDYCDVDWKTGEGYKIGYPATDGIGEFIDLDDNISQACKPSIHMPRWACRIELEVTGVRVERLIEISEADAKAEGVTLPEGFSSGFEGINGREHRIEFRALWESINGAGSWEANPWVWVVQFKRIKP
jgi:hypothetical protein